MTSLLERSPGAGSGGDRAPGLLVPGSREAEAAADVLLLEARQRGLRVAQLLRHAGLAAGARGAALLAAAEAIAVSCAYYSEARIRRRRLPGSEAGTPRGAPADSPDRPGLSAPDPAWLARLVAAGLESLAESLGLRGRQAEVWTAHVRGDRSDEIARSLGISLGAVYRHLARAQEKARLSWLGAYREGVRGGARLR